jgi:transposase-like protein
MASIDRIALLELLRKCGADGNVDFLKEALQVLVQSLMEAEVSAKIGAERYERNEGRTTYRNGYREREWDTRVGTLKLRIPKLRPQLAGTTPAGGKSPVGRGSGGVCPRCEYA